MREETIEISRDDLRKVHPIIVKPKLKKSQTYEMRSQVSSLSSSTLKKHKIPEIIHEQIKRLARDNKEPPMKNSKFLKNASRMTGSRRLDKKYNKQKCEICEMEVSVKELVCIGECKHLFCSSCLHQYVVYKINAFESVECPNQSCQQPLLVTSKLYSQLPLDIRKKFKKISQYNELLKDPKKKLCPKEQCEGFLIIPEDDQNNQIDYMCNRCNTKFCSKCGFQSHEGQCDNNQLLFFHETLHYRQCQKCKKIIEKTSGCNHITCPCGYQFCYICGGKWRHSHLCQNPNEEPIFNPIDCQCLCFQCQCPNCACCQCLDDCCYDCCECFGQCCCDGCVQPCCQWISNNMCCCCDDDEECCSSLREIPAIKYPLLVLFSILWVLIGFPMHALVLLMVNLMKIFAGILMGLLRIPCAILLGEDQDFGELQCWQIALLIIFFPITFLVCMAIGVKRLICMDFDEDDNDSFLCCSCFILRQCWQ